MRWVNISNKLLKNIKAKIMIDGNVEKQLKQLEVFSDQEFNGAI